MYEDALGRITSRDYEINGVDVKTLPKFVHRKHKVERSVVRYKYIQYPPATHPPGDISLEIPSAATCPSPGEMPLVLVTIVIVRLVKHKNDTR